MVVDEADFNKMLSLYYSGINDYFEEHPELRPGRCVLGWDNEGFPILCSKENRCKGCPRRAEHLPRFKSREDFIQFTSFQDTHEDEEGNTVGLDIADPNVNVEEEAILETLFTELVEYLGRISPRYAKIVTLGRQDYSKEQIIAKLGLKPSRGYQEINAAKELTRSSSNCKTHEWRCRIRSDSATLLSSDRLTPIELEPVMALNASHHLPQAVTATVQVILIISLVFVE